MDIRKDILWRVYLCFIGMILLGAVVLGRAFYIQTVEGSHWRELGKEKHLKYMPIDAERGTIYSEDGNMLSTSVPIFDVFIDFGAEGLRAKNGEKFKESLDSLSFKLAELFKDKTAAAFKRELLQGYNAGYGYYPFRKRISFSEYQALRNFPLVRLGRNKSGFIIDPRDKRINPYVLMANRTIGLSREDSTKNVGLERSYDSLLKGASGQRLMRYVAGTFLPVEGAEVEPENGKDIITTLDTYIQDVTETALMRMLSGNNSLHGTAIVMETATGKIKAIANLGQEKNKDGSLKKDKDGNSVYNEDLNYGIGKRTEPGSIFKLATLMSLMEDGYVTSNSIVDCEGGAKVFYGLRIKDSHLGAGALTVKDAFARSSNVAFAKLADQYYHNQPSKFLGHLHKYRLDTITGVDITASSGYPVIKKATSRSWAATTIPFMAHGYEELVTPLHMLTLYNAVANNGKMMKPYLVNEIQEYGVTVRKIEPQVVDEKICSDKTLEQIKDCLLAVVESEHGTAKKIKDSVYRIAGKTGTAVTALDNKGYNKGNKIYQASFIGYFPAEAPKYTVAVVIQNSKDSKLVYGADVSGIVFKEISDRIYGRFIAARKFTAPNVADSTLYSFYGMKKELTTVFNFLNLSYTDSAVTGLLRRASMKNSSTSLVAPVTTAAGAVIPDVVGMGLKDAVYVLENKGLKVGVSGRGRVMGQSLAAGTVIRKGQNILLTLN